MQFAKQYYGALNRQAAAPPVAAFISTWNTANTSTGSSAPNQVKLPLISSGTYNFSVDWGDGTNDIITAWDQAEVTHTYAAVGTYTVSITGTIIQWAFNASGDRLKILDISNWGPLNFGDLGFWFRSCSNFNFTATDAPIIGNTMQLAFRDCSSLVGNSFIDSWDVSSVTNFSECFRSCQLFNQNLNSWNVSNAINFFQMFYLCLNFNGNISSWAPSGVSTFGDMFRSARAFNQNIGNWNVSNGSTFSQMFRDADTFNQNIGNWNVSNGSTFSSFLNDTPLGSFSSANVDNIYNGWTNKALNTGVILSLGVQKYTAAGVEGRALLTRANATVNVSSATNNGVGLVRITTAAAHGRSTGQKIFISGVGGTTEANGGWIITVVDANTFDLNASAFVNAYTSGGVVRTGYGWTITDGGL